MFPVFENSFNIFVNMMGTLKKNFQDTEKYK